MPAHRVARLIAAIAGIAGVVLCGLTPLLPVEQPTATINWPQAPGPDGLVSDVTAPLVSGAPQALDISIPCRVIATMPAAGGVVLGRRGGDRRCLCGGLVAFAHAAAATAAGDAAGVAGCV